MSLGAVADGGGERLAGEHMGAVEPPEITRSSSTFQLAWAREDVKPLLLEEALLIGDGERRHVGELDEAEVEIILFDGQHVGVGSGGEEG